MSAVLDEQIRCAEAMLATLARENEALAGGDHAALELATEAKIKLVNSLERLESQRRSLEQRDDAPADHDWGRLRELIARCKEQNQRNGALLKARAENVRVALKALRGDAPEIYDATGLTPSQSDARRLGSA